jgi:hypothetical protein
MLILFRETEIRMTKNHKQEKGARGGHQGVVYRRAEAEKNIFLKVSSKFEITVLILHR